MNRFQKIASGFAAVAAVMFPVLASAQTTTGPSLGSTALTNAATGGTNVLNTLGQTVANNIQFFILVAAVGVGVWVVSYIFHRFTKIHR